MKAILVIDIPDNLDIPFEDIKASITVESKDIRKSALYLKYKNQQLRPLPQRKLEWNWGSGARDWNACLDEILGETE